MVYDGIRQAPRCTPRYSLQESLVLKNLKESFLKLSILAVLFAMSCMNHLVSLFFNSTNLKLPHRVLALHNSLYILAHQRVLTDLRPFGVGLIYSPLHLFHKDRGLLYQ